MRRDTIYFYYKQEHTYRHTYEYERKELLFCLETNNLNIKNNSQFNYFDIYLIERIKDENI